MQQNTASASIAKMPTSPYSRARLCMQRATETVSRLGRLRDKLVGERPPNPDEPRGVIDGEYTAGALGELDDMTRTLHAYLDDADRALSQLESSLEAS